MKSSISEFNKQSGGRLTPSQLVKKQLAGNNILDQLHQKPRIVQFLNLADFSINTESYVSIDQPLFEPIPPLIQFTDYEPLQIKEKTFKLRNKDKFSRRVKIIQPDSRLFQVLPANDDKNKSDGEGKKVAAGMETKFIVRFSPQAKIDYKYELMVVTEREKFIVPIVAVGKRAMIDFPDLLDFGNCPVKYFTQKPVIIRNLGEKTTKWSLELPSGFSTNQKEGVLECGKNEQIIIKFYPTEAKLYKTVAKLEYDKLQAYAQIVGSGLLSNVYLSKTFIAMEQSYINLKTQQTLQIVNKSNVKVNFEWRAFPSEKEQKPKKELLRQQINEQEAEELMLLRQAVENQKTDENEHDFEDSSDEEKDPKMNFQKRQKKAELALARKYKTIRKAIEDDLFLFQDKIFTIEPQVGEIWPNSQITITVTFWPKDARPYECPAYCNISCAEERLPLKLKGEGIGPKAYLTQQQINFGDVFVNQPIKQTIQIENRGQIECEFKLIKQDRAFAKMFEFSIERKTLGVGQNASIDIKFKSSIPGEFKEKFLWELAGSQKNLEMTFLGHVIAPTFEFVDPNDPNRSKPQINFGRVSYDFDYKQKIILKNTSEVAFTYTLKIQNDGKVSQSEFKISPQTDTIQEKCQKEIQISFIPKSIKKYETVMTIDIEGVGNDMLSVPIRAECQVPSVEVNPVEKLQFGQAFLNYPETAIVTLKNNSDLKAKFHVLPQSEESKILARYTVSPQTDVINERDTKEVQVTLTTIKRGDITLPLHINIVGTNNSQPNVLNICATSIGPPVKVTPEELDFGQVQVLKDYSQKVTIVNSSKIPAEFHAFTKQKVSIFKPMIKHAILKPDEKLEVEVVCNADDASKFNDVLHFVVRDGNDKDVVLRARGIGSTIYCVENLDFLNFQTVYTYKTVVKEIFIQNRGRKSQKIVWQKKKPEKKKNKEEQEKVQSEPVFIIEPESETIPPKYGRNFKFIAHSTKKGKISEQFQLTSQIGTQRKSNILKTMTIEGEFIQPTLIFSQKKLNFKYKWEKDVHFSPISKTLEMTSGSALPLNFTLKVQPPYFVDQDNLILQPGKSAKVRIDFDPSYKSDRVSGIINGKMTIVHHDHPHRETVDLVGEVCFPNIKLASDMINFGSILNDTTKKIVVTMQNISEMALNYEWTFVEEEVMGVGSSAINSTNSLGGGQSVPINEIFDILPLSGNLQPGQVQDVEFVYNALGGMNFRATAVCHVEGGPNYEVKLEGDSSLISAKISQKEIDLGEQRFCEWTTRELIIQNTGKVTFDYKVSLASIKKRGFIEVIPLSSKIVGGEKQKLTVRVCPVTPEPFKEFFTVQMGYFEPQVIVVRGVGVYPSIVASFPRIENPEFDRKLKEEVDRYAKEYESYNKKTAQLALKDKNVLKTKKEMKTVEAYKMEIERDLDRGVFCDLIKKELNEGKPENKLYEGIFLTTWICDFSNVIVGTTQKKQVKIKNVGQLPLDMVFDTKISKTMGYTIAPQKISKMMLGDEASVSVTLTTKKNMKFGKTKLSVPIEVKNGAQYKLDLLANLTIPDLTIQKNPENTVDFGKVLCGQRKTVFLKLLNEKQIPCEWNLNLRDGLMSADKKQQVKFVMNPSSGKISPGGFQIIQVSFAPSLEKEYLFKFPIKIIDNSRVLTIDLKGQGTSIGLEAQPPKVKIGPTLPYTTFEYEVLEIHNPTSYPTELISLDFDKKYKEEQETIATYEQSQNSDKKEQSVIYLPVREPGSGLWPQVVKAVEKRKKIQDLQKKLETDATKLTPEEKQKINKEISDLSVVEQTVEYPKKVDSQSMLHVVFVGPNKSGRTSIMQALKKEHKRAIVNMNELLDWNIGMGTPAATAATQFLQQRKKQYELALQQRDKLFKKAGKKAKEVEDKLGPANEHLYQVLPQHILVELLKERMKHPECAAGCMFDNLTGKNITNQLAALKVIMKTVGTEALLVVTLENKVPNKEPEKKQEPEKKEEVSVIQPPVPPAQTTKKIQGQSTRKSVQFKESKKEEKPPSVVEMPIQIKEENVYFSIDDLAAEQKNAYEDKKQEIGRFLRNQHLKQIAITLFKDPVFEEAKKDQKPAKGGKGAPVQEKPVEVDIPKDPTLFDGHRDLITMPIYQNAIDQKQSAISTVPAPVYRDPLKEPVPDPVFHEGIAKASNKPFESKVLREFSIYTPKDPFKKEEKKEEKKKQDKKSSKKDTPEEVPLAKPAKPEYKLEDLVKQQTRWVIPPNTVLTLLVRFFSKVTGNFQTNLTFQNSFGLKKLIVPVSAKCDFPILTNIPKNLYWTVKKTRPANAPQSYISKAFVQSENIYQFGPLLIGKSADKKNDKQILSVNSTTFRLSNQGSFPAELQFALMSSVMEGNPEYKKGVFTISEEKMTLGVNDPPKEIRVWSLPDTAQKFRDDLIVMIKNNPSPLIIPMQCLGSKPSIDIIEGSPLKFTRILLKQTTKKQLKLKNNSPIPIKFKLLGTQTLPQEFSIEKKEGELKPTQEISIGVTFKAIKQQKFTHKITLVAQDVEGLNVKNEPKEIPVEAEAFDISVDLKFPDNNTENMLDFGNIRVGDFKDQTFTVKNVGLYTVKFSFVMKKKLFKECFRVEPSEVQLEPNGIKEILVRCTSNKELKLRTNNSTTDINMEVLEGKTLEIHKSVPINIAVNAVFSKYSVIPIKNINFGPIQFNETKTRTFEIKNEGLFEFNYTLFDYNNEEFRKEMLANLEKDKAARLEALNTLPVAGTDPKKGKKETKEVKKDAPAKKGKGGKGEPENQLKIGQWAISPFQGSVPPESSVTIEVVFTGSGQKLYEQKLGLDIQNRDPQDEPKGILYELVAESCIPGINTEDYETIFEEQVVMASQQSGANISNMINSNVFYVQEKVFHFGTLVPSKIPDGIVEKFKIQNNNKVPCTVKFDVRKKTPTSVEQFAFEVQPKQIKIPPHEHCYAHVTFKPTIMAMYSGMFEAIVENGDQNPKTHKLLFDLRGQGALPTIKLEKPKEYFDERTVLVKFGKSRVGKALTQQISLKNDGVIPATVKWDLTPSDSFSFLDMNSYTLNPKGYASFNVEFKPKDVGQKTWDISCQTLLNQFEVTRFKIQGQGFFEEVLFQNLPEEQEDKCNFGDCIINKQKRINFSIKNNGNSIIKFQWPFHEDFIFTPRVGHIEPKSSKPVTLIFKSVKTVTHKDMPLTCTTVQIKQSSAEFIDWDDSQSITRMVTKTEFDWLERKKEEERKKREQEAQNAKKGGKKDAKKPGKVEEKKEEKMPVPPPGQEADIQIQETLPEPENAVIEKTDKAITLKASAVADYARYDVESRSINFLPTLMYTSRVHKFTVKNTSLINLKYNCKIVSAETGKIDAGYYSLGNHSGTIAPGCDEQFTLKYSPTEVDETNNRLLVVTIDNLDPAAEKLIIELDGDTERPICHFELPPSKYREKKPDLEAKYNIIEFESLGTKVKNSKRFYVVNPTSMAYEYEWKKLDDDKAPNAGFFRCPTSKGTVLSGKKAQIIFEYTPDLVGTHESYWLFEIPSEKIQQYFFVVGTVIEPNVFFDTGKINFGPLLIGGKNKQVINLKNLEEVPIPFNFDRESIKGEPQYGQSLIVQPISGVIPAQGQAKIDITFAPKVQKQFNYNLSCAVKRKSRAVCINIKGIGYVLSHSVYLAGVVAPLQPNSKQEINFGNIFVNEKRSKTITIENSGDFNFDFAIKKNSSFSFLKFSNEFGTVKKNEKFNIEIQFAPTEDFVFGSNSSISLMIVSGPTYTFNLRGSAKKPGVDFSFYSYDFGPCFVLKQPLPVTTYLEIRNRESTAMSIEPLYQKSAYLDVRLASGQVVLPIKSESPVKEKKPSATSTLSQFQSNVLKVPIVFTPRESIKYSQIVSFDINGLNRIDVEIKGQGVPFKLQVEKTENQNIDFGITKVGDESTRTVSIINLSKKKIDITFDTDNQLQQWKKLFLEVSPSQEISIQPKEKKQIELTFHPKNRIHSFKTDLNYKILQNQEKRKLLSVQTAAHGVELKLMEETVGFGTVVSNSKVTKSVQLANLGDIGTRFEWDTTFCQKFFTIQPKKGYLPAHEDLNFEVTFHPNVPNNDINFKIKCNIEGSDPLFVNLIGKCIEQPKENIQELKFECMVRTSKAQKIQLKNPTAKPWKIKAIISSTSDKNYFTGKDSIEVPANGMAEYEVVYTPLTMTSCPEEPHIKEGSHEGTLFFPIPDGSAILYKLVGKSQPPKPLQTFDMTIKAKKSGFQIIPVKNWLKTGQRFNVTWKMEQDDKTVFVNAANTFDVAGDTTKDYKLSIYALRACQAKLQLTFRNPNSLEYLSYKVNITVQQPDPMNKIDMQSVVRESVTKLITIENPLSSQVEIKKEMLTVDSDMVLLQPNSFTIPPKSEFGFQVIYRPLLAREDNAKITLKSPQLGQFVYPLKLVGSPTTLQRTLAFKTNLGNDITQTFKFIHYGKKATVYNCRVEKIGQKAPVNPDPKAKAPVVANDFTVETATVNAPAVDSFEGIEVGVNVRFEPSSLNESSSQLVVSSNEGGEYVCILNGYGMPPQPKGPFKIAGAKPPPIDFKNPFFDPYEFTVRIDNPAFTSTVKSPVKIDGKKVLSIAVSYKAAPGYSNSGRLIISAGDMPAWVFYLQGQ